MYPKMKVREQEGDQFVYESSLQSLKAFESLSINDLSPVTECKDDSPAPIVRIPRAYVSHSTMPALPKSKEATKNNKKLVEERKTNIRAGSGLRPRAVLSSPDNDGMIGSKSNTKGELLSGLKNQNLCQNRHTQCKVVRTPLAAERATQKRGASTEATDKKNDKGSDKADPGQRAHLSKGKPQPIPWIH